MLIAELYEVYSDQLMGYGVSISRDVDVAEDLLQETFTRALLNLELLKILPESKRRSWLYRVLKNCFIDRKRQESHLAYISDQIELSGEFDFGARSDAMKLLSRLPSKLSDVVFKKFWLGMTSVEIARALSLPAATVRSRLHTALKLLKNYQQSFMPEKQVDLNQCFISKRKQKEEI